jgi:hypothetical protein
MYQIDPNIADTFKIRASALSDIMAGSTLENGLTPNQKVELDELLSKQASGLKPLTVKQLDRLGELTQKFNAKPELPSGAKTYCKKWLKQSVAMYNRRADISTKYTEKGLIVEDHAIDFISEMLNLGFIMKNEDRKENDYMTGCCDVDIPPKSLIIDNKSSWDFDTFPIFDTKVPDSGYEWQGQGYMELYNRDHFWLVYTLMDTPINIIERECRSYSYKMGYGEVTESLMKEFVAKMTYSDVANELKIKVFKIERDRSLPAKIEQRVSMCRTYLKQLISEVNSGLCYLESF